MSGRSILLVAELICLLRLFAEIARHSSFSDAAAMLNMTKGAISYQIKTLEADLGMTLFRRTTRGVTLTDEGLKLLMSCQSRYEEIEAGILALKGRISRSLTSISPPSMKPGPLICATVV